MVNTYFTVEKPKERGGTKVGVLREAVVDQDNGDGTVNLKFNDTERGPTEKPLRNVAYSTAWQGPNGQFIGGYPVKGSVVLVGQGASGVWYIISYLKNDSVYDEFLGDYNVSMSALKSGRALMQVQNGNRIFIDPKIGAQIGNETNYIHADPQKEILSSNFKEELNFTEAHRRICGIIKRDLSENSNRAICSSIDSHNYDKALFRVGLDPTSAPCEVTSGPFVRNVPLVELHEVIYELADSYNVQSDENEEKRYNDKWSAESVNTPKVNRRDLRCDALSMGIGHPNHLIETIKGTAVDAFGNILDINRSVLPIGKLKELSLQQSDNKATAYVKIREQLRKSIAYHFEINARKPKEQCVPPADEKKDYFRSRSKFFIDVDKEGQFKINIPASSETGNIPLLMAYENFSVLAARDKNNKISPDECVLPDDGRDIRLASITNYPGIKVEADGELSSFTSPTDRISGTPILFGTAHHDITKTCLFHTENSPRLPDCKQVHPYTDEENRLNKAEHFTPYKQIVTGIINVAGDKANAGGRSGTINMDGFLSLNIGANTIDRQSLWLDCAGGIVANIGRDKQGISYATTTDGDFLLQVGRQGIGNSFDSRFADQNDAVRDGVLDIRVIANNGQQMIFRMSSKGIDLFSAGRINITSQAGIDIKTNGTFNVESTNYQLQAGSTKVVHKKFGDPGTTIHTA